MLRPMYATQTGTARKRVVVSPTMLDKTRRSSQDANSLYVELLVCHAGGRHASWINVIRLAATDGKAEATSHSSIDATHSVTFNIECAVDSCVGCANFPVLQSKCFSAQECGVSRCVGTMVNMRKPLCSIGQLAAQQLHLFRIALGVLWQAIAQQVVLFVELSESRRSKYEIAWPEESFVAATCQAKDSAVHLAATFTSIAGAIGVAEQKKRHTDMLYRLSSIDTHGSMLASS